MAKASGAEKGAEKGGGGAGKTIMIVAVAMLLSAGVGAGGYFLGSSKASSAPAVTAEAGAEPESGGGLPEDAMGSMVKMDSFIVNILDDQGSRYLKATITLELSSEEAAEEIGIRDAQIRDAILLLIGSKTLNELSDLQGKLQLRADLVGRINSFLTTGKVRKIYFTEFVVQ